MSKLAAEHQSVNLGQGFPDDEGPEAMKQVGGAAAGAQAEGLAPAPAAVWRLVWRQQWHQHHTIRFQVGSSQWQHYHQHQQLQTGELPAQASPRPGIILSSYHPRWGLQHQPEIRNVWLFVQIASKALYDYSNQYPSLLGIPELRQAVARHSAANQQIPCEWTTDTLITVGATEGIAAAFMGMVNPGDEVSQPGRIRITRAQHSTIKCSTVQ
jgi:aspartate/methionine/tyrosine aminotransferase